MRKLRSMIAAGLVDYVPSLALRRLQSLAATVSQTTELELLALAALADSDHVLLDVGANDGVYSAYLAPHVASVHVFEPVPALADRLRKLFPAATIHRTALSDAPGSATLRIPIVDGRPLYTRGSVVLTGQAESEIEIDVELNTLDSLAPKDRLVVKIDVEGHELQVVRGAAGCLVDRADVVLVESEERHAAGAPQAVIDWFDQHGFVGWAMLGRQLIPTSEFCTTVHQSSEDVAAVEAGGKAGATYGNNFLFVSVTGHQTAIRRLVAAGFSIVES